MSGALYSYREEVLSKMKELLKRNYIFIVIIIGMLFCFVNRWHPLDTVVAPKDIEIWFGVSDQVATQTWSPDVKWIESISIPYMSEGDFKGSATVSFFNNLTGENLISQETFLDCKGGESGEVVIDFHHLALDLTTQYLFQLQYEEVLEGNGIYLYGCEKYGGGVIGGNDIRSGLSIGVFFVKYNVLFFGALMLFVLYSFGIFYMLLWNKRFEETVGLGVLSIGFVLYIFGLNSHLEQGVHFVVILAAVMFAGIIYLYNKREMKLSQLYCPTMVIFAVIFAVLLVYNRGVWYTRSDEYSHWGLAVKDMYYFNAMLNHPNTTVVSLGYPPFATLLEYFFTYWNGLFSEPMTYVGYQVAMVSLLAVCWKTEKKRTIYTVPLVLAAILVPIMFINDSYCTIYADALLGAIMAYLMVCWFQEGLTGFNVVRICLGLIALTLTKRPGLFFAALFIGVLVIDNIFEKRSISKWLFFPLFLEVTILSYVSFSRYSEGKNTLTIGVFLLVQMLCMLCWFTIKRKGPRNRRHKHSILWSKFLEKKGLFVGLVFLVVLIIIALLVVNVDVKAICYTLYAKVLYAEYDSQQGLLWLSYLIDMWTENTWTFGWYHVSYMGLMAVLQVVCAIAYLLIKRKNSTTKILKNSILLTFGAIGYGMIVLVSRISLYNMFSGTVIDSHERYLGSYGMVVILLTLVLLVCSFEQNVEKEIINSKRTIRNANLVLSLLMCVLIVVSTPLSFIVKKNDGRGYNTEYMSPFDDIEKIVQSIAKIGDRVFYITNNGLGANKLIFTESVSPWLRVTDMGFNGLCASEAIYAEYPSKQAELVLNVAITYVPEERLTEILQDYQYVFIMKSTDYFVASYRNFFEDPNSIDNGSLYMVKYDEDGKLYLELIGKIGVFIC